MAYLNKRLERDSGRQNHILSIYNTTIKMPVRNADRRSHGKLVYVTSVAVISCSAGQTGAPYRPPRDAKKWNKIMYLGATWQPRDSEID